MDVEHTNADGTSDEVHVEGTIDGDGSGEPETEVIVEEDGLHVEELVEDSSVEKAIEQAEVVPEEAIADVEDEE